MPIIWILQLVFGYICMCKFTHLSVTSIYEVILPLLNQKQLFKF